MTRAPHGHRRAFAWAALMLAALATTALAQTPARTPAQKLAQTPDQQPDPWQARFDQATGAMAQGQHARAAAILVSIADDAPAHALADDALFTAARLFEERLTEPARALATYQRLVRDYPDSRTAMAARRRADDLAATMGATDQGAVALARFTDILNHFTERGERESITLAETVLAEYPDWSGRSRVLAWLGDVHRRTGQHQQALTHYLQAVAAADSLATPFAREEALVEGYRGAGEAALALGRFDAAEGYFRAMPIHGDPSRARSLDDALERVDRQRVRARLYQLAFAILAALGALFIWLLWTATGSLPAMLTAARTVPVEVIFMLPIAGILIAASTTAHYAIAPAVTIICVGGIATAWLSGVGVLAAHARPAGLGWWRPPVHAVASAGAAIALVYIALHHNRLVDMIIETVRFGPDL